MAMVIMDILAPGLQMKPLVSGKWHSYIVTRQVDGLE